MKQAGTAVQIVVPRATIFSEHPAVVIDRSVSAARRPVIDAFMQYLWSEEAQRAFVKHHFRSTTNETLNQENKQLANIEMPITIDYFGGWIRPIPK